MSMRPAAFALVVVFALLALLYSLPAALALNVKVAPQGTLPVEAVRLDNLTLVIPGSSTDTVSFFLDDGKVMMVSQVYPMSDDCLSAGHTSLEAHAGEFCLMMDDGALRFKLDHVDSGSVEVERDETERDATTGSPSSVTGLAIGVDSPVVRTPRADVLAAAAAIALAPLALVCLHRLMRGRGRRRK